jgi:anti-anti-sigma factor
MDFTIPALIISSVVEEPARSFSMTVTDTAEATSVTIGGELDFDVADRVGIALAAAGRRRQTSTVVVDVSTVSFIDVAGLRCLIRARRAAIQHARDFHLVIPRVGPVRRLLALTGLERVLDG